MKTYFKNMVQAYSGKCDGLVYYYLPKFNRVVCRKHTPQKITENNHRVGSISKVIGAMQKSQDYKDDFYLYTNAYNCLRENRENKVSSWYNLYFKAMHAMAKAMSIDLTALTYEDIYTHDYPCKTVAGFIAAGLLPEVRDWQTLTHEI